MSAAKKTGRRQVHFVSSTGETVVGLSRRPSDGRWRVIGTQKTFTEPDEAKAIERFRQLSAPPIPPLAERRAMFDGWDPADPGDMVIFGPGGILAGPNPFKRMWAYVAKEIRKRPVWVAEQTGVEQIGYFRDLKPPEVVPPLAELLKTWNDHAECSAAEVKRVAKSFRHFTDATDTTTLEDITVEAAIDYRDVLKNSGYNGKTQKHMIAGIRRVLRFAQTERGVAPEAVKRALTTLEVLKPSESSKSLDPKPIEVETFCALLGAANDDDRAMILLMLNGSFYLGEVIELEWADIRNGCIVTNRKKTGENVRVCTLWPETQAALAKLPKRGEKLFYTYQGLPIKACGAFRRFKALAKAAGVEATPSQLRDGAYTTAVESGAPFQFCQLLNGHATGMADHYVKRNPEMVRPACDAIRARYLGTGV